MKINKQRSFKNKILQKKGGETFKTDNQEPPQQDDREDEECIYLKREDYIIETNSDKSSLENKFSYLESWFEEISKGTAKIYDIKLLSIQLVRGPGIQPFIPLFIILSSNISFLISTSSLPCYNSHRQLFYVSIVCIILTQIFMIRVSYFNPGFLQHKEDKIEMLSSIDIFEMYCEPCGVTFHEKKDKRVYHCEICNLCVENYDHHCFVFGNCISKSNLRYFYATITFAILDYLILSYLMMENLFGWCLAAK